MTVPSGYAGLTFHTFEQASTLKKPPKRLHFKPLNKVYQHEIRQTEQMEVLKS